MDDELETLLNKTLTMVDDNELQEPPPPPPLNEIIPAGKEPEIREWYLPDELTKLILVRLPANELIGCKLVSKLWLSLISSPDFISDHIRRSISDPSNHLLLFHYDPVYDPLRFPPNPFRSIVFFLCTHASIVGSTNGLICVVDRSFDPKMSSSDIWILNPVTGHITKLPPPPKYPTDDRFYFDKPGTGKPYFVFWWDSITDEYKVARIVPNRDYSNTTVASLWVSGSPENWSEIPVGFYGAFHHPSKFVSGCDIVVGDFAYWIVFDVVDGQRVRDVFVLLLDLKTLTLSLSKSPFPLHSSRHDITPQDLFESLASRFNCSVFAANWEGEFVLAERVDGPKMYDVWAMDAVQGWSKKCSFDYPVLKWINDVKGKSVVMITVHSVYDLNGIVSYDVGWGEAGLDELDELEDGIALFDIGTGEAEPIKDFISGDILSSAHDFVGSLVSIKGFKPLEADDDLIPHLRVVWPDPSAASGRVEEDVEEDDEEEED